MLLSKRIFFPVIIVVFGLIAIFIFPISTILITNYNEHDNRQAKENTLRVFNFIEEQINIVARSSTDWSRWDDTVLFITGADPGYVEEEIPNEGIPIGLNINIMGFVNSKRKLIHQITVDLQYQRIIDLPQEFDELVQHTYTNHSPTEVWTIRGLTLLENTPTIVSFAPVTSSDRVPPTFGTLIFGKFLDTYAINQLNEALQLETKLYLVQDINKSSKEIKAVLDNLSINDIPELPLDLYLVDDTTPPNVAAQIKQHKLENQPIQLQMTDKFIYGYALFRDLDGKPLFIMEVATPRRIYEQGFGTILVLIAVMFTMATLISVGVAVLINRVVYPEPSSELDYIPNDKELEQYDKSGIHKVLHFVRRTSIENQLIFQELLQHSPNTLVWITDTQRSLRFLDGDLKAELQLPALVGTPIETHAEALLINLQKLNDTYRNKPSTELIEKNGQHYHVIYRPIYDQQWQRVSKCVGIMRKITPTLSEKVNQ